MNRKGSERSYPGQTVPFAVQSTRRGLGDGTRVSVRRRLLTKRSEHTGCAPQARSTTKTAA
jgi:hypothetical protein